MKPQGLHNFMGSPHPQPGWSLPFPHHLPSPAVTQQQKNISPAAGTFHQQPVKAEFPCIHQGVTVELNRVQQPGQDPNPTAHRDKVSFFYFFYSIPVPHFGPIKIRVCLFPPDHSRIKTLDKNKEYHCSGPGWGCLPHFHGAAPLLC